jgi:hypothetical protein
MPRARGKIPPVPAQLVAQVLANPAFIKWVSETGDPPSPDALAQAWLIITPSQKQTLAAMFGSWGGVQHSESWVAQALGIRRGTVNTNQASARITLRAYLAHPDSWVPLPRYIRVEVLINHGIYHPDQLTAQVVELLVNEEYGCWKPQMSLALDQRLTELGEPPLHLRITPERLRSDRIWLMLGLERRS